MTSASLRAVNTSCESQAKKEVLGICTAPWQPELEAQGAGSRREVHGE